MQNTSLTATAFATLVIHLPSVYSIELMLDAAATLQLDQAEGS